MIGALFACLASALAAQSKPRAPQPNTTAAGVKREPAQLTCPSELGVGVSTKRVFCDVLTGRDPAQGVRIVIPSHRGEATLTFDLHNRQTYSEQQVKAGKAYTRYTSTVGVLTLANEVIARAVIQSEFRQESDLVDRIAGGAGPGGIKAVAPTGTESISVAIPANVEEVSLLGEVLSVETLERKQQYTTTGVPIAVLSNVFVEYRPGPPARRGR